MWISKEEYRVIINRIERLENSCVFLKTHGVDAPRPNVLSANIDNSHVYLSIKSALQLIINHFGLEYEPSIAIPDKLTTPQIKKEE